MTSGQLLASDIHVFAMIAKLKQQSKRTNIDSIHTRIIKTVYFEDVTRGNLQERMNSLISDGKIVNELN